VGSEPLRESVVLVPHFARHALAELLLVHLDQPAAVLPGQLVLVQ
jgi:hypothetical protein